MVLNTLITLLTVLAAGRALADQAMCSDIRPGVALHGETLVKFDTPKGKTVNESVAECCEACNLATGCEGWTAYPYASDGYAICWLYYFWEDDQYDQSNFAGKCTGRVATEFNTGNDYDTFDVTGLTKEAREKTCCDACTNNATKCEGWLIYEETTCYLYKFTYEDAAYFSGFSVGSKAKVPQGSCSVLPQTEGRGTKIDGRYLRSTSQADQDNECCSYCSQDDSCEFWIRSTDSDPAYCWKYKDWRSDAIWESTYRTGFKQEAFADKVYCKVLDFTWRILGAILRRITFPKIGSQIQNLQVDLPTSLQCGQLSYSNGKVVGALNDMTIAAHVTLNNFSGIYGNVSVYVRADPSVTLDFKQCRVDGLRSNVWDLGLGMVNSGTHYSFIKSLSGNYQSNLRKEGCDRVLVALPNNGLYGNHGSRIDLDEGSQEQNNMKCCQHCQDAGAECDAFETDDDGSGCWLYRLWEPKEGYHGNWKYKNTSMGNMWPLGEKHAEYQIFGDTQEERDASCSAMCDESEHCDMWSKTTTDRTCQLQSAGENSGIIGTFRWIVNWIIDGSLVTIVNSMMKLACKGLKDIAHLEQIVENFVMDGFGTVSLDVPEDFWHVTDILKLNTTWGGLKFPVESKLDGIVAMEQKLKDFVKGILGQLEDGFEDSLGQQIGSPIAFFVGSMLKACIDNGDSCPTSPPHAHAREEVFV